MKFYCPVIDDMGGYEETQYSRDHVMTRRELIAHLRDQESAPWWQKVWWFVTARPVRD